MLRRSTVLAALFLFCLGCRSGGTPDDVDGQRETHESDSQSTHWGYSTENGPDTWAALDDEYALCGEGLHQSPIDLADPTVEASIVRIDYHPAPLGMTHKEHVEDIVDNGHTIQVDYDEPSEVDIDGAIYRLRQFHFHAPSEHTVKGKRFPLEMHLVHQAESGEFAVGAILFEVGEEDNAHFEHIVRNLPDRPGESRHVEHVTFSLDEMILGFRDVYRYSGSLTTPPCSEGVEWVIRIEPLLLSQAQIDAFAQRISPNNRPVQPLGDRLIAGTTVVKLE